MNSDELTVLSEYDYVKNRDISYQSEQMMEDELIRDLCSQGYTYLKIDSEKDLIDNLRVQIEKLNDITFTDNEWDRFFNQTIKGKDIIGKTKMIQEGESKQILYRDNGTDCNITLINKTNIYKNTMQVINQYEVDGAHKNRYDVTILVNGLPMVHIELKRRGVKLREAFNQIKRYQRDSFWAGSGLYEYVQLFVISNGTETKYYSNTTRYYHSDDSPKGFYTKSDSFQFTSYWTTSKNKLISDICDFTRTFLAKRTLLNIICKYCVLTTEDKLLVMRPYQIAATEAILQKINIAYHNTLYGSTKAGGYIWHSTGSGKTLTSFKTSQLAVNIKEIYKVFFVVDRKDLDYQTIKEYERFEEGCVDSNTSTAVLTNQINNKDKNGVPKESKIIVTTIQKLTHFMKQNPKHDIYDKHVVLIFDECHRNAFGKMHELIVKQFKKYYLFGFTGTPIFEENAIASNGLLKTTQHAFGDELHKYMLVNAINDKNVLPFRMERVNTIVEKEFVKDEMCFSIDTKGAIEASDRIKNVVEYIIDNFSRVTLRNKAYTYKDKFVKGFNSILSVDDINMAMAYYSEFKRRYDVGEHNLKVATIFTYEQNESVDDVNVELGQPDQLDTSSKDFLESAIQDYANMFGISNLSTSKFDNYYKDVAQKMKNRQLDLLIVVNMFLTGFDAPTLNTLWVDKNLKQHGLIQAYSRTNRILNDVKTHGNIVCFRDLSSRTEEAIKLFSDDEATRIVLMRTFNDFYYGYDENGKHYDGYKDCVDTLTQDYPLPFTNILGEEKEKSFIKLFSKIIRLENILNSFENFDDKKLLNERDRCNYLSYYLTMKDKYQTERGSFAADVTDSIEFETEIIDHFDINVDYILNLLDQEKINSQEADKIGHDVSSFVLEKIDSSPNLRSKKELIRNFLDVFNVSDMTTVAWEEYITSKKKKDLEDIIIRLNLVPDKTIALMDDMLAQHQFIAVGERFGGIVRASLFGGKDKKLKEAEAELRIYFDRYHDILLK